MSLATLREKESTDKPYISPEAIESSIKRFLDWLDSAGYESYDPYDLWGTAYGLWARKIYYKKGKVSTPLVAPIIFADIFFPSIRKLFVKKKRYATSDAQILLAYLNLHQASPTEGFLDRAVDLEKEIFSYSVSGYQGLCWGYPFDWQNNKAMWPKNTPFITCTPYCYEAYLALNQATGSEEYLEKAQSIANFVYKDLNDTRYDSDAFAGSYSPLDNSMVINASAYRAYVLISAGKLFNNDSYLKTGLNNLKFILRSQREDGSWLYGLDTKADQFIDNFHTCFVLKNLHKINCIHKSNSILQSIKSGFNYYRDNLIGPDNRPKSFSQEPRLQLGQLEMYNYAEAITLGSLLHDAIPEAWHLALSLANDLTSNFQRPEGFFVTRTFKFGFRHTFPFIRWPQAQLFYALTNLQEARLST